jgi:hypothetical protein
MGLWGMRRRGAGDFRLKEALCVAESGWSFKIYFNQEP